MNSIVTAYSAVDTIWVLLGTALVFFMQAGFAMVETGFTRAKNAGNIIMKNLMDFAIGTPLYWLVGFSIMFGPDNGGIIGSISLLCSGDLLSIPSNISKFTFVIFQSVFCATSATIVSGAMAERTKFLSYCLYSALISAVVYPISGHWIWGGGWLAQLGFHDFAGSTAVHMVGGVAALVGAAILGPRIGKYSKDGKVNAFPGHSIPLGALGVFILWFCWFGFNGCSTLGMSDLEAPGNIFMTTNLAAATATVVTMIITWVRYKKPDVSMTLNGSLAGLVAITAGCDAVSNVGAFFIGIIAAFVVVFGIEFLDRKVKIDDPVGAIAVHGMCGAVGTILVGFFAIDGGVFYGGGFHYLGVQMLGVVSVIAWVVVTMTIFFNLIKKTVGLRVDADEEIRGMDIVEHGLVSAYADFMPMIGSGSGIALEAPMTAVTAMAPAAKTPKHAAVPVEDYSTNDGTKISKIAIITKQSKFETLKNAMDEIGVTGMTVTQVLGCGMQKGRPEYYRGIELESTLLPKIEVEIVVCKIPVSTVIEAAKNALYTGHIGDGKIFVYDVEQVVKVRTGEEGFDALQDVE
ncbi:MAG: ammonium transporter [Clostridiales bacterium]|nr:ammonium transporter [Clostridiales bacterium]